MLQKKDKERKRREKEKKKKQERVDKGIPRFNTMIKLICWVRGFGRGKSGEQTRDKEHLAIGELVTVRTGDSIHNF